MQLFRSARKRTAPGISLLLLLWISGLAAAVPAHGLALKGKGGNRRADRDVIVSMESQWRRAVMQNDAAAMDKLLSDDFLSISSNGTLADKQGYLRGITRRQHTFSRLEISETKIRVQPGSAIVTSRATVDGLLDGAPLHGVFRYTRVYGKTAGVWKVVNFEATRVAASGADAPDMRSGVPVRR